MAMDLPSFGWQSLGAQWLGKSPGSRKQWDDSLGQRLIPYGQAQQKEFYIKIHDISIIQVSEIHYLVNPCLDILVLFTDVDHKYECMFN